MPVGENAYIPLANVTLAGTAATVTFSSIPGTYRDLILISNANNTGTAFQDLIYRFNADSGSNYNRVGMFGAPTSSIGSFTNTNETGGYAGYINGTTLGTAIYSSSVAQFMDYSATDKHKTGLHRYGIPSDSVLTTATRWASTSAVTSLLVFPRTGSFNIGSTFNLYGIVS